MPRTTMLIGTPAYGGTLTVEHLVSLRNFEKFVARNRLDVEVDVRFLSAAHVVAARNSLASMVLNDTSISHLLFVDVDMGYRPETVLRMLEFGKPFVGCMYPQRNPDYAELYKAAREVNDAETMRSVATSYISEHALMSQDGQVAIQNGFVRAHQVGTGLLLLSRSVFETIAEKMPELVAPEADARHRALGVNGRLMQCFESYRHSNGFYLSEDYSFCERWKDCGGEIWALVNEPILHVGRFVASGNLMDKLRRRVEKADRTAPRP